MVFLLPGVGSALTHVKATGYNKNGRCVRMLTPAQRTQKRQALTLIGRVHAGQPLD